MSAYRVPRIPLQVLVYDRAATRAAWAKRREDLDQLGDVGDVLTDVDRQIAELQQRVTALFGVRDDLTRTHPGRCRLAPAAGVCAARPSVRCRRAR